MMTETLPALDEATILTRIKQLNAEIRKHDFAFLARRTSENWSAQIQRYRCLTAERDSLREQLNDFRNTPKTPKKHGKKKHLD